VRGRRARLTSAACRDGVLQLGGEGHAVEVLNCSSGGTRWRGGVPNGGSRGVALTELERLATKMAIWPEELGAEQ
jgi:hypothetical protein